MRIALIFFLVCELLMKTTCSADNAMSEQHEFAEILQQVIDAKELSPYYHADIILDRIPLRLIKNSWVKDGIDLHKFGRSVEVLQNPVRGTPYMNISDIQIIGASATVSFEYPPEGLVGTAQLSQEQGAWFLNSITIHER